MVDILLSARNRVCYVYHSAIIKPETNSQVNSAEIFRRFGRRVPGETDSDGLRALFTPSGRLRRLKRWRVLSNSISHRDPDTQNEKGPPFGDPLSFGAPGEIRTPDRSVRSHKG
jgi:hypothetical protein